MKVLHVIGQMGYGGAELLTCQLATRMADRNFKVAIAVLGFCEPEVVSMTQKAGIEVIRFGARLNSPANIWRIVKLVMRGSFDVVHVHLFPALYWGAVARAFCGKRSRWIYTEHSTSNRRRKYAVLKVFERFVYRTYDRVVCISSDAQHELLRWLPGLHNTTVIHNGVDLERFRHATPIARKRLGLAEDDVIVLMVGAFRREKNQVALVKTLSLLPNEYKLVLAGDGPELENVKDLVGTLDLTTRVIFLGVVGSIEQLMKAADVYVLPSLFEGFGLSAVEAAAAGLPIVYADVPGLGTMFGGAGIAVDPRNPVAIAAAIVQAASEKDFREDMVTRSEMIAARFSLSNTETQYKQLYRSSSGVGEHFNGRLKN